MGKEQGPEFYTGYSYRKGGYKRYLPLWNVVSELIPNNKRIIDIGCGPGCFARVLLSKKKVDYIGIDFSQHMITMAKSLELPCEFILGNIKDPIIYTNYTSRDIFVCLEVLEHVSDDYSVLDNIPKSSDVILSLPSGNSAGHVRYFPSMGNVIERYEKQLIFYTQKQIGVLYLFKCERI